MVRKERYHKAKLENNKPVLHCRFGKNKPWVDITYTRFDVEKLKFVDKNENEHGFLDCKSELVGLIFKLFLSFVCSRILYDGELVWTFKYHFWSGHPLNLCLNLLENVFYLNFHNNHKTQINVIPKTNSHLLNNNNTIDSSNTVNNDDNVNKVNNDNVKNEGDRRILVVVLGDRRVDEIFYNGEQVWDREPGEPYPVKYISNEEVMEFVVIFDNSFKVCNKVNGNWVRKSQKITKELRATINSLDLQN
ncbi:hypothetical protein TpMuguga_02g00407 [Theileria parva strain Muguga]|uniref:Uncharacterized protein n=1 Tax=Theileria parva TaxID=5875 RepID=Q4N583_THEPA|nr:uncharacterized protein TpMuguga_02g00407 [Theileria parva strain Muguga]EAN32690.1 hypothetical protein TpMuguga_02g00407 [Theileria parva strain Muguga]|eukprot:XP_764973.1 hypothetical protein [Theileria parva strain Muguga]